MSGHCFQAFRVWSALYFPWAYLESLAASNGTAEAAEWSSKAQSSTSANDKGTITFLHNVTKRNCGGDGCNIAKEAGSKDGLGSSNGASFLAVSVGQRTIIWAISWCGLAQTQQSFQRSAAHVRTQSSSVLIRCASFQKTQMISKKVAHQEKCWRDWKVLKIIEVFLFKSVCVCVCVGVWVLPTPRCNNFLRSS